MNRFWYFLVILLGCRSSDGTAELDAREGYSIAEGSREARAVLQLANTATQDALDGVVGLDARAAEAIVNFRRGADGTEVFETLAELDGVPYVGSAAFEKLLAYAQQENLCGLGLSTEPGFVVTTEGAVRGLEVGETFAFKGIPFAAPPVGKLRWRAPGAPACWAKERPASEFSAECMQQDGQTIHGSEDCLYLNVWTPSSGASTARPVMVYIHGGGNITGDAKGMDLGGGNFLFEGQDLAERADVVVVTVQYRLGVFGFLAHPALAAESPSSSSGNYALRDQLAALQWVRDNIREFGGDPNHVLLFGESAGGLNVSAQIASPLSKGLFAAAIMQSGGYEAKTKAHADSVGEAFVSTTGCDQDAEPLDCLRNLDAVDVVKAVDNSAVGANGKIHTQFGPTVDGVVLLDSPLSVVTKGTHNHVPFVIGVNADETASPLFQIPFTLTQAGYQAAVQAQFPNVGNLVLSKYPVGDFPSPRAAMVAVTTDYQFICPARRFARAAAQSQSEPVYRYLYSHSFAGSPLGAAHGHELLFVFQKMSRIENYQPTPDDTALESAALGYWTRFAATGDPNGDAAVEWKPYDAATDPYLDLHTPISSGEGLRTDRCDFWDSLAPP